MNKFKLFTVASALLSTSVVMSVTSVAHGSSCTDPVKVDNAIAPTSVTFMGSQISREAMNTLWNIVAPSPPTPHELLGRIVAQDQDWLGVCGYPGIGIGAGSGWNADSKNVTLWFWATEVDVVKARQSIAVYIGAAQTTTTTTSTTTTTTAPIMTATEQSVQLATMPTTSTSSTTTTTVPVLHSTFLESVAVSQAFTVKAMSTVKRAAKPKPKPKPKKVKWSYKQTTRSRKHAR